MVVTTQGTAEATVTATVRAVDGLHGRGRHRHLTLGATNTHPETATAARITDTGPAAPPAPLVERLVSLFEVISSAIRVVKGARSRTYAVSAADRLRPPGRNRANGRRGCRRVRHGGGANGGLTPVPGDCCHDGGVKRSTAIGHLVETAGAASERLRFHDTDIGWPLDELWVTGELLGPTDALDAGAVVLVLDVPADELPWLAIHPVGEWIGDVLRLGKRPYQLVVSAPRLAGLERRTPPPRAILDGTRRPGHRCHRGVADQTASTASQLQSLRMRNWPINSTAELAVSRRYLRAALDHYWDHDWRREHSRNGETPEDHLWRAAIAVEDIRKALDEPS